MPVSEFWDDSTLYRLAARCRVSLGGSFGFAGSPMARVWGDRSSSEPAQATCYNVERLPRASGLPAASNGSLKNKLQIGLCRIRSISQKADTRLALQG